MKRLEAKNQVPLGPRRCVGLALAGMGYRLTRSLTTTAILALAVAFLTHIAAFGLMEQATVGHARQELESTRSIDRVIGRTITADTPQAIRQALADEDPGRLAEYRRWAGLDDATLASAVAKDFAAFDAYIHKLSPDAFAAATRGQDTPRLVAGLSQPEALEAFKNRLDAFNAPPPVMGWDRVAALPGRINDTLDPVVRRIVEGHERVVVGFKTSGLDIATANNDDDAATQFAAALRGAGYVVQAPVLEALPEYLRSQRLTAAIAAALRDEAVRSRIALRAGVPVNEVALETTLRQVMREPDQAGAWWTALGLDGLDSFAADDLLQLAARQDRLEKLRSVAGDPPEGRAALAMEADGVAALPTRTLWLIGLSMLVCVVGVANAMLMSVTERFTEIATMKCLGAMDGSVLGVFVTEAFFQGILGGVVGMTLGLLLALLRGVFTFGTLIGFATEATGAVLAVTLTTGLLGILLAVGAAVGPSILAARLAPMEAMRVE